MIIEKISKQDIREILPFWEAQVAIHHVVDPTYTHALTPALSQKIENMLEKDILNNEYEMYAAKENNEILGFVAYRFVKTDLFYTQMNDFGEIYNILVKDTHVKQGLGKILMDFAENKMRENNIPYSMLIANPYNTNGYQFYKHLQYIPRQAQFFKKLSGKRNPTENARVEIAPLTDLYKEDLLKLWQEQVSFHYHIDPVYGAPLTNHVTTILQQKIEEILNNAPNHTLLLAIQEGKAVGFIDYAFQKNDHYYTPINEYGQIYNIYVEERSRHQKIGHALIEKAELAFEKQGMSYAMLWAMPENSLAIGFYESLGYQFKQVQMVKNLNR